jgi:MoxR-like ATPase
LLTQAFAAGLALQFGRIQFTPDLMPGDVLGTNLFNFQTNTFVLTKGPIFTQLLLADEINRTPPKTQSALLESMQERSCTVRGNHYKLPEPFFVLATQNPIELEGTYPLPEAQLDRFLFNTLLDYLTPEEEMQVIGLTTTTEIAKADPVTNAGEILEFQQLVRMVPIADSVARYAIDLVRATRPTDSGAPDFVSKYINYGGSVRAAQFLVLAAKTRALMSQRYHVTYEDIRSLVRPVLRHRILLNFQAESERLQPDDLLKRLLEEKPAPKQ